MNWFNKAIMLSCINIIVTHIAISQPAISSSKNILNDFINTVKTYNFYTNHKKLYLPYLSITSSVDSVEKYNVNQEEIRLIFFSDDYNIPTKKQTYFPIDYVYLRYITKNKHQYRKITSLIKRFKKSERQVYLERKKILKEKSKKYIKLAEQTKVVTREDAIVRQKYMDAWYNYHSMLKLIRRSKRVRTHHYLVYNGRIKETDTKKADSLKARILYELHNPEVEVRYLAFNNLYKEYKVNKLLAETNNYLLQKCVESLPDSLVKITKEVKISYQEDTNKYFWVSTNGIDKIYISPYLIRAAFLYSVYSSSHFLRSDPNTYMSRLRYQNYEIEEIKKFNDSFQTTYENYLLFILGHELAHIYLPFNPNISPKDFELLCDFFSYIVATKISSRFSLKPFEYLFTNSIESGMSKVWGLDNSVDESEVVNRINILKDIKIQIEPGNGKLMFIKIKKITN